MDISVITPTYKRPHLLITVCECVKRQRCKTEHIIVSDGDDEATRAIADHYGAHYYFVERRYTSGGAGRNLGIQQAHGDFVVYWDDDNYYNDAILQHFIQASKVVDIVVCKQKVFNGTTFSIIPKHNSIIRGEIDTACFCIRRSIAEKIQWECDNPHPHDYKFLADVLAYTNNICYIDYIGSIHVPSVIWGGNNDPKLLMYTRASRCKK